MKLKSPLISIYAFAFYITVAGILSSCASNKKVNTDYLYFQNGPGAVALQQKETVIQPGDMLGIEVYSKTLNQEQAKIFNIPPSANGLPQGYQVSQSGTIDMPIIGTIKVVGLSKNELQFLLVQKITDYVKNPSVIVRFLQFSVNLLGEVRSPGIQRFNVDRVTIIDALSSAGDLTDFGRRQDITVIREEQGKKIFHTIDLRSKSVFESPVYVLQPNDIVYVKPNNNKLRAIDVDQESQRRTNLYLSFAGFGLGIISLLVSIIR
jgi:polysaccharide biosynthesis/export protein